MQVCLFLNQSITTILPIGMTVWYVQLRAVKYAICLKVSSLCGSVHFGLSGISLHREKSISCLCCRNKLDVWETGMFDNEILKYFLL